MSVSVTLHYARSTAGTHVFENRERKYYGVYVPKSDIGSVAPAVIELTITPVSGIAWRDLPADVASARKQ